MLLLMTMLLIACGGSEEENSNIPENEDCYLDIYVYAPDRPIVTRADMGNIAQRTAAESEVKTLQIWAFKHSDGSKVGYFGAGTADPNDVSDPILLNENGQQVYRMKVDKAFADTPVPVDVYVVANAASCGLTSLGPNTQRSELDNAVIGSDYFGTTSRVPEVPDNGLPMSAVAKQQPVFGSFPALRIGTETKMTTLQLTRAVSKLRFVLCRIKEETSTSKKFVSIDDILLTDGEQPSPSTLIPTNTYLMPGTYSYTNYVSGSIDYVEDAHPLTADNTDARYYIPFVKDPLVYTFEAQGAQEYEDLINKAISGEVKANAGDENLKELGLTYLRESDKQLKGTIKYKYLQGSEEHQATATFSMAAPGDFLRNHSWIIYIYYMDSKIYTLSVANIGMRRWGTDQLEEDTKVYNW